MGLFGIGDHSSVESSATIMINAAGKSRVESGFAVDTKHKDHYAILSTLAEGGPTTVDDLAAETRMPVNKVKAILRTMIPKYVVVQPVSNDGFRSPSRPF